MNSDHLAIHELKKGFHYVPEAQVFICNVCGQRFENGEVFPIQGRFFEANRAVEFHVGEEHGDNLKRLLHEDSKYNSLTDNQKQLLSLIHDGLSDKEISGKLGVSTSTVRHQRFMFREKAKQAKLYLAIYEQVAEKKTTDEERLIQIHPNATMVDERYLVTEKENLQILKSAFISLSPLKLKAFPSREKKKIVVLRTIARHFEQGKKYTENEINEQLRFIFDDHAVLRRYLVDYGFMYRTPDGKEYGLN
ncbi:DUF2087 domain-containing protein [Paenibacillus hemerocallicola]|uniref:DUF2087 domain-containing protein n=1 Tax=Paenibacillus hemerocallicola TaxID=1172614 RepID=A0A5C4SWX2_9BACL|nr:DUF2087 domain-containing protein [Paenibacillus hemerocallicola]TNJ60031.1 DUF2087 domain-containing protein [Paenibacillus hemerocallicola]